MPQGQVCTKEAKKHVQERQQTKDTTTLTINLKLQTIIGLFIVREREFNTLQIS